MKTSFSRTSPTLRPPRRGLLGVLVPLCCLLLAACTTTQPGPASRAEAQAFVAQVKPGDFVACEMRNGPTREFTVLEIKSGWLIGQDSSAYGGDIVKLRLTRESLKWSSDEAAAVLVLSSVIHLAGRGY